ncbi:hypothetical protein MNEG_14010, partial [Monoraphidium neglectum]
MERWLRCCATFCVGMTLEWSVLMASQQAKGAGALAAAYAVGLVSGWLLSTYARSSLEDALTRLQAK